MNKLVTALATLALVSAMPNATAQKQADPFSQPETRPEMRMMDNGGIMISNFHPDGNARRIVEHPDFSNKSCSGKTFTGNLPQKPAQAPESETVKLNVNVTFDMAEFMPTLGMLMLATEGMYYTIPTGFSPEIHIEQDVLPGTYDVMLVMRKVLRGSTAGAYLIKQNVDIKEDTELELDMAEVTNQIKFRPYTPDGKFCSLDLWDYDEETETPYMKEKGEVDEVIYFQTISSKKYGTRLATYSNLSRTLYNQDTYEYADIFINDVSDDYFFGEAFAFFDKNDELCIVNLKADKITDEIITNQNIPYISYTEHFVNTPAVDADLEQTAALILRPMYNGMMGALGDAFLAVQGEKRQASINISQDPNLTSIDSELCCSLGIPEVITEEEVDYGDGDVETVISVYGMQAPYIVLRDNGFRHIDANSRMRLSAEVNIENYYYDFVMKNGHPAFSYDEGGAAVLNGETAPICAFVNDIFQYPEMDEYFSRINPGYIGMLGEVRTTDFLGMNMTVTKDGKVVDDDAELLNDATSGVVEYLIDNTNIRIDGIDGRNTLQARADWSKADKSAPVLQALTMKDADGRINNRFASPDKATLEFAGGDFKFQIDPIYWTQYYDVDPVLVKVEWSPNGREDWTELEVTEVPDEFYMPGFGYFYRANLASVNKPSANGWFDLRIEMEDRAGNVMTQTISPVFKIDSLTGVGSMTTDPTAEVAAIYNPQGQRVNELQPGVNLVRYTDGTTRKLLITK